MKRSKKTAKIPTLEQMVGDSAPPLKIDLDPKADIKLTLKGFTVLFLAQAIEKIPLTREVRAALDEDIGRALRAAFGAKSDDTATPARG